MASRIRGLATARYVTATPAEMEKIAEKDTLEQFSVVENRSLMGLEVKSSKEEENLDIPPPSDD